MSCGDGPHIEKYLEQIGLIVKISRYLDPIHFSKHTWTVVRAICLSRMGVFLAIASLHGLSDLKAERQ